MCCLVSLYMHWVDGISSFQCLMTSACVQFGIKLFPVNSCLEKLLRSK
uniref:Uncharacterized protein n=1 Tax=Arundo donax TaxID=35708 RepID=A0A0A8ZVV6_ARUDO